jgi:hypothetical protein
VTTIAYDRPVKNLIAQLDATGHVSHVQHRKTHVTLHHNGARLSHEGVLEVWKVRPASAHLDVDVIGDLAQYVRVAEYAWATGSTIGNQKSISIEMCNLTLGPDWLIPEPTWRSAARLTGWLFARVIGYRPTPEFVVPHHFWNPTLCAGPHLDRIYDPVLQLAQKSFDQFMYGTGIIEEEFGMGPQLRKGDVADAIWLVEVKGDGGVSKVHVKDQRLVEAFASVVGPVKTVEQWKLDWFAKTGEIG